MYLTQTLAILLLKKLIRNIIKLFLDKIKKKILPTYRCFNLGLSKNEHQLLWIWILIIAFQKFLAIFIP